MNSYENATQMCFENCFDRTCWYYSKMIWKNMKYVDFNKETICDVYIIYDTRRYINFTFTSFYGKPIGKQ